MMTITQFLQACGVVLALWVGLGVGWYFWGRDRHCPHDHLLRVKSASLQDPHPYECSTCGRRVAKRQSNTVHADPITGLSTYTPRIVDRTAHHVHRYEWNQIGVDEHGWACACGDVREPDRTNTASP